MDERERTNLLERLDRALSGILDHHHGGGARSVEELRLLVRQAGAELYTAGGNALMSWALDQIELRNPDDAGARVGILDARWDGIGQWVA